MDDLWLVYKFKLIIGSMKLYAQDMHIKLLFFLEPKLKNDIG